MALSPSHRFGQIIGDLLEEVMGPQFEIFCSSRGLYLDKSGVRGAARDGKKVSWLDKYGNSHDLDFVIEKGGSANVRGRPLAFIEAAWRRGSMPFCVELDNLKDTDAPIHQPAAMLVAAD